MGQTADDVARYYDDNTRRFLSQGEGGEAGALHRPVWGHGVSDLDSAVHFVEELILDEIEDAGWTRPRLLDLGCGVGASLHYLLDRSDAEGFGITVSGEQFELARKRSGPTVFRGDFCRDALPPAIDLAYGIESFVHGADARSFFENVTRALRPGGRLVLVDDFLVAGAPDTGSLRDFVWGWHAASLMTTADVDRLASAAGLFLSVDRDLTPHLALDRPRDRAIQVLLFLIRPLLPDVPRTRSLVGGDALRKCLKLRLVEYRFRVYRKPNP